MKSPEAFALSVALETATILRDALARQLDAMIEDARDGVAAIERLPSAERRRVADRYKAPLEAVTELMRQATRGLRRETG